MEGVTLKLTEVVYGSGLVKCPENVLSKGYGSYLEKGHGRSWGKGHGSGWGTGFKSGCGKGHGSS